MVERSASLDEDFTVLLNRARGGDEAALEAVWRSAYDELRVMARGIRGGYVHRGSPSPTTIIHEAFLKTFGGRGSASSVGVSHGELANRASQSEEASLATSAPREPADVAWDSRAHFFGSFARAMAQFLIDWRRTANRLKRGGGVEPVALREDDAAIPSFRPLTEFDRALREVTSVLVEELDKLQRDAPDLAHVVWLRYMAALSLEDTASILGIAPRTVSKRWNAGRAILRREIGKRLRDFRRESDTLAHDKFEDAKLEEAKLEKAKFEEDKLESETTRHEGAPSREDGGS